MSGTSASPVRVREVVESDLGEIARLHVAAFPESVLGRLGQEAVRRNYQWQLDGPHDLVALVAIHEGAVSGFVFGGFFRGSTIGFVKREKWFLLQRVLKQPSILLGSIGWSRVLLAIRLLARRSTQQQAENPNAVPPRSFGILAIAVDPTVQGTGTGSALLNQARLVAAEQGYLAMHLTVHPSNLSALGFYRSLGWSEMYEPNGEWVGRMALALDGTGSNSSA